jgi:hypothetical protein
MKRPIEQTGARIPPFSLRLSFEERSRLERNAGNMPLGSYIKSLLFAEDAAKYRKRRRVAELNEKLLAEVLACIGASRIANNLNQLAKAANTGSLFCDDDTKRDINRACADVHAMRELLLRALGVETNGLGVVSESTSQSFARAAAKPKPTSEQGANPKRFTV